MSETALDPPATPVAARTRFERIELLGRGGMGDVWKGWDHELEMQVALKSLRATVAADPKVLARFKREAKIARRIKHVNVAQMFDLVEIEGVRYLAMEHVEGRTLKAVLQAKRALPVHVTLGLMRQICAGVQAAHDAGVIHRDLKPHNIMVTRHGRICILDFGIACEEGADELTDAGVILGSPQYLSYEQLCGQDATARSDIYQLGILLYEMVTGISPFRAPGAAAAALRAMREIPPDPRQHEPRLPKFIADIILRCLSKYPEDRFASASALWVELDAHRAEEPPAPPPALEVDPGEVTIIGIPTALVAIASEEERQLVSDRLERLGCQVTVASDGQGAVEAAWGQRYSLVVLSAGLSRLDGITACQILRRSPNCAGVPIVMLLDPSDGRDALARDAGASSLVHAPVNIHALARTVREILAA